MKRIVAMAVAALTLALSLAGCGGSPNCDALKAQCDACTNATGKTLCTTTHDTYVKAASGSEDACKTVLDLKTYEATGAVCK